MRLETLSNMSSGRLIFLSSWQKCLISVYILGGGAKKTELVNIERHLTVLKATSRQVIQKYFYLASEIFSLTFIDLHPLSLKFIHFCSFQGDLKGIFLIKKTPKLSHILIFFNIGLDNNWMETSECKSA